jgi:spermidine synthase
MNKLVSGIILFFALVFLVNAEERLHKEVKSKYSHIKIVDYGTLRSMLFVRDSGEEVVESTLDISVPQNLFLLYTQKMFAGFLVSGSPGSILMAGLGGGSIVHFTNYYFPKITMDVVEIDPEVVKIARADFGLREKSGTRIIVEDIYKFLKTSKTKYDMIFMDAFLKPTADTDTTGINLKQKETSFFQDVKARLNTKGAIVFNVNSSPTHKKDIEAMKLHFPNVYIFRKSRSGNIIVLCSLDKVRYTKEQMQKNAELIDNQHKPNFSFQGLVKMYDPDGKKL